MHTDQIQVHINNCSCSCDNVPCGSETLFILSAQPTALPEGLLPGSDYGNSTVTETEQ